MSFVTRLLAPFLSRTPDRRKTVRPLWNAVIAAARAPHWYRDGGVADTLDGRFEAIAMVLALVLGRLEDDPGQAQAGVALTELFVDDMDGQIRQIGFGDLVVGKEVGKIMAALGGRIAAYRAADDSAALVDALGRNLWRGDPVTADQQAHTLSAFARLRAGLGAMAPADLARADSLPGAV